MLGSLRVDVCIFLIFGLTHTGFFNLSENFDIIEFEETKIDVNELENSIQSLKNFCNSIEDNVYRVN